MKQLKRMSLAAAASLLLTGCAGGSSVVSEPDSVPTEKHLVVLGDSISAGYGLDDPVTEKYSTLLTEKLNENTENILWSEYNYAVSGDDSSDLLYRLDAGRAVRLPSADRIVICIGANNLLGAYTDYLTSLVGDADYMNMTDEELAQLEDELTEKIQNDTEIAAELETSIDAGLTRLETDLEKIYSWIRERNPDAEIYVMNIYNPYAGVTADLLNTEEPLGEFAQTQLDRCNAILEAWEKAHPDLIAVDLAAEFAEYDPVPIIGDTAGTETEELYLDPHPNAEGHKIIADLLYTAMARQE